MVEEKTLDGGLCNMYISNIEERFKIAEELFKNYFLKKENSETIYLNTPYTFVSVTTHSSFNPKENPRGLCSLSDDSIIFYDSTPWVVAHEFFHIVDTITYETWRSYTKKGSLDGLLEKYRICDRQLNRMMPFDRVAFMLNYFFDPAEINACIFSYYMTKDNNEQLVKEYEAIKETFDKEKGDVMLKCEETVFATYENLCSIVNLLGDFYCNPTRENAISTMKAIENFNSNRVLYHLNNVAE